MRRLRSRYCHEKVPPGTVEAINGNIRAVLRRGRDYRDHEDPLVKVQRPHRHPSPSRRMNTGSRTDSGGEPILVDKSDSLAMVSSLQANRPRWEW